MLVILRLIFCLLELLELYESLTSFITSYSVYYILRTWANHILQWHLNFASNGIWWYRGTKLKNRIFRIFGSVIYSSICIKWRLFLPISWSSGPGLLVSNICNLFCAFNSDNIIWSHYFGVAEKVQLESIIRQVWFLSMGVNMIWFIALKESQKFKVLFTTKEPKLARFAGSYLLSFLAWLCLLVYLYTHTHTQKKKTLWTFAYFYALFSPSGIKETVISYHTNIVNLWLLLRIIRLLLQICAAITRSNLARIWDWAEANNQ